MNIKYIGINNDKVISLKNYLKAWSALKSVPKNERETTMLKESLKTWWPVSVNECLKQYSQGVHERINLKATGVLKYV